MSQHNDNDRISRQQDSEQPEGWFDPESFRENRGNQNPHAGNPNYNDRYQNIQQSQMRNQFRDRDQYNRQFGHDNTGNNSSANNNYGQNSHTGSGRYQDMNNDSSYQQRFERPSSRVPYGDRFNNHQGRTNHASGSNQQFRDSSSDRFNAYPGRQDSRDTGREDRDWWDRASDEVASWFGSEDAEQRRRRDKLEGPHKGKGPKGYSRTDERIREDINERLYHDSFIDASEVEVRVENGEAVISGVVESREAKRRIEDIAESIPGVRDVENKLKVNRSDNPAASSGTRTLL